MAMPRQKRGESKQDYETPREFLDAVEKRWGALGWDLACRLDNAKAPAFINEETGDSLVKPWPTRGRAWLNPPFSSIAPWARRCAEHRKLTCVDVEIFFLTPASVCTDWFTEWVMPNARVYLLKPRIAFDGMPVNPKTGKVDGYPKDLILSVFGHRPGFEVWRWK